MAIYALINTESNEIVNLINWDPTSSYAPPSGYNLELYDSESYGSYTVSPSSFSGSIGEPVFSDIFDGTFIGKMTGSIDLNGEDIETMFVKNDYAKLFYSPGNLINGSFITNTTSSVTEVTLSLNNLLELKQHKYESNLHQTAKTPMRDYLLTMKDDFGLSERQYLVKNTEISGAYALLNVEEIYITNPLSEINVGAVDIEDLYANEWVVSIDLGEKAQVGKFIGEHTGSFTGSFDGDFFVDGEKFDETFKIAPKPCTILKYEEDVINQLPTDGGLNPQGGYFIFDKNTSINGDYDENSWRIEKPTRIRLNLQTLGETVQQNDYEEKLFKIIRERLGGSEITLEQILPNFYVNIFNPAYKKFAIIRGIYRERSIRKDANREYPVRYHYLDWGSQDFVETDRYFGQEDIDYFYGDGPFGLDFNGIGTNSARDGFFEFEVKQLEPLNVDPFLKPEQDAEFRVCVRYKEYRREITVFDKSGEYSFPEWADQITIYTVGAGGGGGGGAWGYPHKPRPNSLFYVGETVGDYSDTTNVGHEWVVGGGGGAGGSVAIGSISKEQLPYYNRKLIVMVGAPGFGGDGLSYDLPKFPSNDRSLYFALNQHSDPTKYGLGYYLLNIAIHSVVKPESKNFGKKGGDSLVYIKNSNKILVKAQGGSGGNCGLSTHYAMDKLHNGYCWDQEHRMDDDIIRLGKPFTLALGGGGSVQESIGDILRPGGHGGYGIATTPFYKPKGDGAKKFLSLDVLISTKNSDMNNAPNIPWHNNSMGYLKTPMGRLNNNTNDVGIFDVKALSKEQPNELAPPGGGGGFGVRLHEINDEIPRSTMFVGYSGTSNTSVVRIYVSRDLSDIGTITVDGKNYENKKLIGTYSQTEDVVLLDKSNDLFRFTINNNELIIIPNAYTTADSLFRYKTGASQNDIPQMGEIILQFVDSVTLLVKIHKLDLDGTDRSDNIERMISYDRTVTLDSIETLINNKVRTEPIRLRGVGRSINNDLGDYYELNATTLDVVYDGTYSLDNDAINYTNNGQEIIVKMADNTVDIDTNLVEKVVFDRFTKNINDLKTIVLNGTDVNGYISVLKVNGVPYRRPIPNVPSANNLVIPIITELSANLSDFFNPILNANYEEESYTFILSDAIWLDENLNNMEEKNKLFITPLDGVQRHAIAAKYANLGKGGKVLLNNNYLLDATDSNGKSVKIEFGDGGNGGFAQYFSAAFGNEFRPDLSNTLPEDVSNRIGVGGGGGAAVYLKKYEDKDRIGDPDVPSKGQDGADGGPGIVVIVAEKYSF